MIVRRYMTQIPHTIGADQTLEKATRMMIDFRVRHLPVLKAGELVGIVSDRDIQLVETLKDVNPSQVTVDEAYTPEPFSVSPEAELVDVCEQMLEHKYGSALVVDPDKKKLVGIFTWIDALRALSTLLEQHT